VRLRLRADAPMLAELSGGLDSSSIVCMADDVLARSEAKIPRLGTLSYYDRSEPHGDDWTYFQKVEEIRGIVGDHIDISKYGNAVSLEYPHFAALPGFLGAGQTIQAERAAIVRSRGYRAVLSGLGGDEFMGGVPNPTAQLADLIVQFRLVKLAKQLLTWSLITRRPWIQLLWETFVELLPPVLGQHFARQAKVESWIKRHFAKRTRMAIWQLDVDEHFRLWLPTRRSYIAGMFAVANNMSKRIPQSVPPEEVRYPYLDQRLIEFVLSIPASQLLRPGERRSLLRRSLASIVPHEILSRRTKQTGARTPRMALRNNWEYLEQVFHSALSSRLGFIEQDQFLKTMRGSVNGRPVNLPRLIRTVSLELWLRDLVSRGLINTAGVPPDSYGGASAEA
jgi:asparagine synthase (glutamine-hydrolysing)